MGILLPLLAAASRSAWQTNRYHVPWYSTLNVASSSFSPLDERYVPPLPPMNPMRSVQKMEAEGWKVAKKPSSFMLPTEAHLEVKHGRHEFTDDVWLRFHSHRTDVVSASRVGVYDMGVNKQRVERLRSLLSSRAETES